MLKELHFDGTSYEVNIKSWSSIEMKLHEVSPKYSMRRREFLTKIKVTKVVAGGWNQEALESN